jgi:4-amino-4-deoxy-L-arabinose transferase-like glycosyltransferase
MKPALLLAASVALGVTLRFGAALALGDSIAEQPGIFDEISYDTLARQVLAGHGFSFPSTWWPATRAGEPTAHWSFLYTLYLTGVYSVFGQHPMAARLIQALVAGVLCPLLAWRIGRRVFGAPVGLAAAGLATVYGYFVYYAGALVTETFFVLAVLWTLDLALQLGLTPTRAQRPPSVGRWQPLAALRPWLLLGLALGIAALLRQLVLLLMPLLFVWLIWATLVRRPGPGTRRERPPWRSVLAGCLVASAVVSLLVLPWTARNYQAFGRFVLLNTNSGYVFFWANHPIHGTDFVPILPSGTYQRLIPAELRALDEAALDQALLQAGVRFVLDDPARYALLSLSRVKAYFEFWPSPDSSPLSNVVRTGSFGLYLPFMVYGLVLAASRYRSARAGTTWPGVVLLAGFVAVYSLIHLLSWALIRYRLPVDAVLMPFAGLAVVHLTDRVLARTRRHWPRRQRVQQPTVTAS